MIKFSKRPTILSLHLPLKSALTQDKMASKIDETPPETDVSGSKLETELVTTNLIRRPISRDTTWVQRHADVTDLKVDEFDFNYDLETDRYPVSKLHSPQELFVAVEFHKHLSRDQNFLRETKVDCLSLEGERGGIKRLKIFKKGTRSDLFSMATVE